MSRVAVPAVLIAAAVILAGCGKSAEMKKMEADLSLRSSKCTMREWTSW